MYSTKDLVRRGERLSIVKNNEGEIPQQDHCWKIFKKKIRKDKYPAFDQHFVPRVPPLSINTVFVVGRDYELSLLLLQ